MCTLRPLTTSTRRSVATMRLVVRTSALSLGPSLRARWEGSATRHVHGAEAGVRLPRRRSSRRPRRRKDKRGNMRIPVETLTDMKEDMQIFAKALTELGGDMRIFVEALVELQAQQDDMSL